MSLRLQAVDDVPRLVGNPFLVDRVVDARQDAHDLAAARVDSDREQPSASITSINSVLAYSQGRAWKAIGFEVSAPTGQRSTTLPCSSEVSACLR